MSILSGKGKVKLNGQKALTKDKPILSIEAPDVVYIPLVLGMATDFDVHVKEGDHVCIGTKIATRKSMYVPIYSSVSGTVKGIEKRMHASNRLQQHIVIENDHKNEYYYLPPPPSNPLTARVFRIFTQIFEGNFLTKFV